MRIFKTICCTILAIALAASFALSAFTSTQQKRGGGYSTLTTITDESREWILDQFGDCRTIPELLTEMDHFAAENFTYGFPRKQILQNFWLDTFLFEDDFLGVCFDFSCFAKCVVLVWKEAHQRDDVQVYVYDVRTKNGGHSYNFIMEDGHTWFLCLTTDVTRASKGQKLQGPIEITGETPREYAQRYDEHIYNIN